MLLFNGINDSNISLQVSQLLFQFSPDHLHGLLARFGVAVVFPLGFDPVGSGSFCSVSQSVPVEDVNDFFSLLPGFVQQGCIRRKPDILRGAGGIQNQGSLVFFLALATSVFFLYAVSGAAGIIVFVIFLVFLCLWKCWKGFRKESG